MAIEISSDPECELSTNLNLTPISEAFQQATAPPEAISTVPMNSGPFYIPMKIGSFN